MAWTDYIFDEEPLGPEERRSILLAARLRQAQEEIRPLIYRQNTTKRSCAICNENIQENEWMMDFFREESSKPGSDRRVMWAHERCVQKAVERWIVAKEKKK